MLDYIKHIGLEQGDETDLNFKLRLGALNIVTSLVIVINAFYSALCFYFGIIDEAVILFFAFLAYGTTLYVCHKGYFTLARSFFVGTYFSIVTYFLLNYSNSYQIELFYLIVIGAAFLFSGRVDLL